MERKDYSKVKFGYWKFTHPVKPHPKHKKMMWRATCTFCNRHLIVLPAMILSRRSLGCKGCSKTRKRFSDNKKILNKIIGSFQILKTYRKNKVWKAICKCKCGSIRRYRLCNILNKNTKSCGCLRWLSSTCKKTGVLPEHTPLVRTITHYRNGARKRKLDWRLSITTITNILTSPCWYCGKFSRTENKYGFTLKISGIDRIDSTKGYIKNNVRPCCTTHNKAKLDLTEKQFKDMLLSASIYRYKKDIIKLLKLRRIK